MEEAFRRYYEYDRARRVRTEGAEQKDPRQPSILLRRNKAGSRAPSYSFGACEPDARRERFLALVDRLYRQLRYGCDTPGCTTPICLSCQKRHTKGPFRRLTAFSARALASFLASEDYPEVRLCPNIPRDWECPEDRAFLDRGATERLLSLNQANGNTQPTKSVSNGSHPQSTLAEEVQGKVRGKQVTLNVANSSTGERASGQSKQRTSKENEAPKDKDPKSLIQNLFNTVAYRTAHVMKAENGEYRFISRFPIKSVSIAEARKVTNTKHHEDRKKEENSIADAPDDADRSRIRGASPQLIRCESTGTLVSSQQRQSSQQMNSSQVLDPSKSLSSRKQAVLASDQESPLQHIEPFMAESFLLSHFTTEIVSELHAAIRAPGITRDRAKAAFILGRTAPFVSDKIRREIFSYAKETEGPLLSRRSLNEKKLEFAKRSMISILSCPKTLLQSFVKDTKIDGKVTKDSISIERISHSFLVLLDMELESRDILSSLWRSLGEVFAFDVTQRRTSKCTEYQKVEKNDLNESLSHEDVQTKTEKNIGQVLSNTSAAHIFRTALAALLAHVEFVGTMHSSMNRTHWTHFANAHKCGLVQIVKAEKEEMDLVSAYQDPTALDLVNRLARSFASRRCLDAITKARNIATGELPSLDQNSLEFADLIMRWIQNHDRTSIRWHQGGIPVGVSIASILLEWFRTVILREWDGKAAISRWGPVGGALDFMACLYDRRIELRLTPDDFVMPYLSDRLDPMDMPVEWLSLQLPRKTTHLLSYSFLFRPAALVTYFRAINYAVMFKAFEASMTMASLTIRMSSLAGGGQERLFGRLKTAMANYLVLEIRRKSILTDAMNQLWRRQKRELLRPLKVRMGMDEGEEGVDHGGVQQEFFRIAIGEALKRDYGLFVTDEQTRMSWFQPCSLEPLYKFELLGLLTSLAIYNGLTLPMTFPLALYRKILDLPVTSLEHIADGWPDLAKGLGDLLAWSDGDVEGVFVRSYVFTVETLDKIYDIDMERQSRDDAWPEESSASLVENVPSSQDHPSDQPTPPINSPRTSSSSEEGSDGWVSLKKPSKSLSDTSTNSGTSSTSSPPPDPNMVTNRNRAQYVADYVFWLTDKSIRPQYEAFARGLAVCLDRKALSIFTPDALQRLVEGVQHIDPAALCRTARYENGYSPAHPVIKHFWAVVHRFSPAQLRRLLEFVTASDRVPVNGIQSIQFVIQRNGSDNERLPTSLTCFGRLLLPEYTSARKLKERLLVAIENCQGFGVA